MKHLLYALILSLLAVPALAEETARASLMAPSGAPDCPFVENSNINVTFNSIETDLEKILNIMSTKISEVEAFGKEKEMTKVALQSSNYSINANNGMACAAPHCQFQFYGSANFLVEPASKASDFMAYLVSKGITANLSVNSYRQCN